MLSGAAMFTSAASVTLTNRLNTTVSFIQLYILQLLKQEKNKIKTTKSTIKQQKY